MSQNFNEKLVVLKTEFQLFVQTQFFVFKKKSEFFSFEKSEKESKIIFPFLLINFSGKQ